MVEQQVEVIPTLLAIDPGNDKTGLALLSNTGGLVERKIIASPQLEAEVTSIYQAYPSISRIVCGNGTNHRRLYPKLEGLAHTWNLAISLVNEAHTTEEAKRLYWVLNPPKGLRRLLPKGMLVPPEPVDDITAYVIGQRWIQEQGHSLDENTL